MAGCLQVACWYLEERLALNKAFGKIHPRLAKLWSSPAIAAMRWEWALVRLRLFEPHGACGTGIYFCVLSYISANITCAAGTAWARLVLQLYCMRAKWQSMPGSEGYLEPESVMHLHGKVGVEWLWSAASWFYPSSLMEFLTCKWASLIHPGHTQWMLVREGAQTWLVSVTDIQAAAWAAGCLWGINSNGYKEIWGLVIFIAVEKARLSPQHFGGWHRALHSVRALPIRSEPFSPLFWSTWSAPLRAGKQIRSLTFPMTLTQIPVSIDQQSAYLNGTCPIPFLTMPHSFQSGRKRIENQSSDIKKDFLIAEPAWGLPVFLI